MDAMNSNGFHPVIKEVPCSVTVKTPPQLNGHTVQEQCIERVKAPETNSEDEVDAEKRKDKKQTVDAKKDAAKTTIMDQDLEFYPIDEFNSSPSTFTAWDAFMTTNQAFFREPPCYSGEYAVADSFAYMDVIPEEDDLSVMESDTDDTGSSVSTVIDKFSRTSTANSSFSERIRTVKDDTPVVTFDLEQVLSPFEQLEKELDGEDENCDNVVSSGPLVVVTPIANGDLEEQESVKIQESTENTTVKDTTIQSLNNGIIKIQKDEEVKFPDSECRQIIRISSKETSTVVEKHRSKETHSLSKTNKRGNLPEKPSITVTPPLPNKPSPKNTSTKSKKEPADKASPQVITPARKKEPTYPTPTVPPRMSKHLPARRTRSDPGSAEPSTPSRIPRPTYVIKSTSEKTPPTNSGSPRSGHAPKTKVPSPKMVSKKKVRCPESSKTVEEFGKSSIPLAQQQQQQQSSGQECRNDAIIISIKSAVEVCKTVSNNENLSDSKCTKDRKSAINSISDDTDSKSIPQPAVSTNQKPQNEKIEQNKELHTEIKNIPNTCVDSDSIIARKDISKCSISISNVSERQSPSELKIEDTQQNGVAIHTNADKPAKQMSIPKIEIVQDDQHSSDAQNELERELEETNCQEPMSKPMEQQLLQNVEDMLLNNISTIHAKTAIQKCDAALDLDDILLSDELNLKNFKPPQTSSENVNDLKQATSSNFITATDSTECANGVSQAEPPSIESLEKSLFSQTQEQKADALQQQRPIRDILQALDNLCLSSVPKEVQINIDWNDESGINIKQEDLSASRSPPLGGSNDFSEEDSIETEMTENSEKYIAAFMQEVSLDSVGESQQTTQYPEPLPVSAQIAFVESTPSVPVPETRCLIEKEDETNDATEKVFSHALKEKDATLKKVEDDPAEDGREGDHADTKGQCHREEGQRPSRSSDSQSFDVISDDFAMDMLNKFEKKNLPDEGNLVDCNSYVSRPFHSNEFQQVYATGVVYLGNENSISGEVEDPSSTRHSSGCDDSGVFLEDLPYTPENSTTNATVVATSVDSGNEHSEKFEDRKQLSPDMRQYSIDAQGLDSDAEKSDDLGLASSSVDSADDLDGDPLPSRLKIEPPSPLMKKPPPVPPRKSVGQFVSQKELILTTNGISCPEPNFVAPLVVYNVTSVENDVMPPEVPAEATKKHSDGFKWKSEECLRSTNETRWLPKQDMKNVSVKDRIAMFSEMETTTVVSPSKTDPALHRYPSENCVNSVPSEIAAEVKCQTLETTSTPSDDFPSLNRHTKWYSMYSLPLTSSGPIPEAKPEIRDSNTISVTSSLVLTPTSIENINRSPINETSNDLSSLKVETENHQRCSDKPIISSYPKTQLANNKRYNYGRYSLNPIRTTDDLLSKKNVGLLSIIDSRKQPVVKLKGLVIPDKPQQSPTSKALPTIVSNDSVILNSKTDADIEKDVKRSMLSAASYKTMSLPRTRNELKAKLEPVSYDISKYMPEPPWKSPVSDKSTVLPKYSPAFKSRTTLDLPNAVTSSLSPTPPSSITSPLSPPPSSPSSICSSNASSATSVATMQQNIFQFSLSHSKPVTPVLPEKPIMSPPSLPSDIEYEGDNSEDSSTSASPMTAKLISNKQLGATNSRYEKSSDPCRNTQVYSNAYSQNDVEKNSFWKTNRASTLDARSNDSYIQEKSSSSDRQARQQFLSSVNKTGNLDYRSLDHYNDLHHYLENGNPDFIDSQKHNSLLMASTNSDVTDAHTGRRHIFSAMSQEVQAVKYRAQPLSLNQVVKNGTHESETVNTLKESAITTLSNEEASRKLDMRNGYSNNKSCKEEPKIPPPDYAFDKNPWPRSSDIIRFKRSKMDSEEDEDDSHSSLSHRTEDSRPTTDDYFSDATTDSFDKSLDPDLKPRRLSQQKVVLKAAVEDTDSVQKFKALASKWEQRTDAKSPPPPPPPLIPAPRKEQKPYAGSIPATSSFLSSVINSTSSFASSSNNYATPISSSLKLPPSLMPRSKQFNSQTDVKNSLLSNRLPPQAVVGSERRHNSLSSEKDFKNSYESVFVDDRSRKSSINGSRDVSDSGSGTDTGSSFSRKPVSEHEADMLSNSVMKESSLSNGNHVERKDSMSSKEIPESRKKESEPSVSEIDSFMDRKQNPNFPYNSPPPPLPVKERKRNSIGQTDTVSSSRKSSCTEEPIAILNGSTDPLATRLHPGTKIQTDVSWRSESNLDVTSRRNSGRDFQSSDFLVARSLSKSQASLRDPLESVRTQASSSYFAARNSKSASVSDIRKAFEHQTIQNQNLASKPPPLPPRSSETNGTHKKNGVHRVTTVSPDHKRLSSLDSTASGDLGQISPVRYGSVGSLSSISRDMCGSVTSLASTTSLISPQELQQLIDEANQLIDEDVKSSSNHEIQVIVLQREVPSGSIGITLAGGADYEIKEITVHKVICGSLADRDGRLKKGDKVISINGKPLKGTTHREALDILKAPRPEVVLVISREKGDPSGQTNGVHHNHHNGEAKITSAQSTVRAKDYSRQRRDVSLSANGSHEDTSTANIVCVHLQKDAAGLGFSIEGGKDSPNGDRPLLIKRIFKGGVADKEGKLQVGDEIISVNGQSVTSMTRTEAWNFLKKLPEEPILLRARKQVSCTS